MLLTHNKVEEEVFLCSISTRLMHYRTMEFTHNHRRHRQQAIQSFRHAIVVLIMNVKLWVRYTPTFRKKLETAEVSPFLATEFFIGNDTSRELVTD